ncbi:putative glycerol-1-phosphate prenyltransferase [Amphibacillus marinus]|uniref:Heptaprenylglyceryl phosphate synthase n=1 Tax=Amphibacillus marinus TaxID=872970 RepID=A0A1H8LI77_9BACI|nr:heptaprenylglyceryl phosphate synthase [Amphibacillus marinus]SEO04912.1 putative glycerol-1-phosphate prenyltransferase [Amphibacillus marinus]
MYNRQAWKHVFKLDPAKTLTDDQLDQICESGTDAIIVGGTDNVTLDGVLDLMSQVRRYTVPCVLEVSTLQAVTPGFDFYDIPMVLNSQDKKWMMDVQHQAIKEFGHMLNWDELVTEGYVIMNPDAKAYKLTNCYLPNESDVIAYAQMAEYMFRLPVFYLEYSGMYGDIELVKQVRHVLKQTQFVYGGGITTVEQAKEMAQYADTIVVGNSLYEQFAEAIKTVAAVKEK